MWGKLIQGLSGAMKTKTGQWTTALLLALGIGLATNEFAVQPMLDAMLDQAKTGGSQAGNVALQWLGFLNFDKAVTMVFSAYAARNVMKGAKVFLSRR